MDKRSLNYEYSFKCSDELQHFDRLPDHAQFNIEQHIVGVICESFVKPADEDYVTARLLAQKGMHRAFFWAASQAIEKYLKAFLLMRGVSVKPFNHAIRPLYNKAARLPEWPLTGVESKPHPSIAFHPNVAESFGEIPVEELLAQIQQHGSADNRYNSFGVKFNMVSLFALDTFLHGLRGQIGVPNIQENFRRIDPTVVETFNLYNPWFSLESTELAELPNESFNLSLSDSVTTLDRLVGSHPPGWSDLALQWLNKKMKLPNEVQRCLK